MNKLHHAKRQAILGAAKRAFITYGYSGTSIEMIAETAPVSKPTLYNHFKGKQDLFAAVIADQCQILLNTLSNVNTEIHDPVAGLKAIASAFVELIYTEESLQLYRLLISEQQQFPELGALVYQSGPSPILQLLSAYLEQLHQHGILQIDDVHRSSRLFIGMFKGDEHFRCLLGLQQGLSDEEKQELIHAAVSLFLKGHDYAG